LRSNCKDIMKNLFKIVLLLIISLSLVNCCKDDDDPVTPIRDYAEQYAKDLLDIENYLKTYYIESVSASMDITFKKIPEGGTQTSIWLQTVYPLQFVNVEKDNITYKMYYLQLRQGTGATSKSPTNYDSVLTAYKGYLLNEEVFETNNFPNDYFNLGGVIRGWSEIFPKFKTGTYIANTDGTLTYNDFGAGVVFIPSGLGYYSQARTKIPSYSPLIFNFKLYEVTRIDHDSDGIFTYQEDINNDGFLRDNDTTYEDDSDQDGTPNFLDVDDDGDNYLTKSELKKPDATYHTYETVPGCDGLATDPARIRRHLTTSCKPPFTN
jgi:hypothetical protein